MCQAREPRECDKARELYQIHFDEKHQLESLFRVASLREKIVDKVNDEVSRNLRTEENNDDSF